MSICGLFGVLCLVSRWPLIRRRKRGAPVGQPAGPAWVRHPSSCQLHRHTSQNILGALHTSCFNNHTVQLNWSSLARWGKRTGTEFLVFVTPGLKKMMLSLSDWWWWRWWRWGVWWWSRCRRWGVWWGVWCATWALDERKTPRLWLLVGQQANSTALMRTHPQLDMLLVFAQVVSIFCTTLAWWCLWIFTERGGWGLGGQWKNIGGQSGIFYIVVQFVSKICLKYA